MKNKTPLMTEEEAAELIAKAMQTLAKRGVVYNKPEGATEDFTDGETKLFGPQTELDYRRLLKELKEAGDDGEE